MLKVANSVIDASRITGVVPVLNGGTGVTTSTGTGNNVLATSPTLVTPALGTPSSGTVTNLTGTASININGTVGATTAAAGAFTTLSATGTLSGGTSGTAYSFSGSAPAGSLALDASGNLGVNTTPSAWLSTIDALQVSNGALYSAGNELYLSANEFTNSSAANIYINTGFASLYAQNSGQHRWYNAPSGTAGNAITFTQAMTLDASGILTISAYGAGAATFSAAGVISSVSDETWKIKDGVPVDTDAMLKKLEPGYWYYNEEKAPTFGADRQLGFYAQNVNAAIGPEAAPTPEEGKPWGYYDRSVLAITVMSLQKALATIELLTARITALETA